MTDQTPSNQNRIPAPVKWLVFIFVSAVVVFFMVEMLMRFYFRFLGTEIDRVMYVYSAGEILEAAPSFIGLPFVAHGPSPLNPEHNSLGYRGPEISLEKPEGVFRIAATGGSTTYGAGVTSAYTWPAQLQQVLHDEYGYAHVEVVNTASVGYTSWNSLTNFEFRVLEMDPDMLIVYHATNDTKGRLRNPACYRGENPIRGLTDGIWRLDGPELGSFVVLRYLGVNSGRLPNPIDLNNWVLPLEESLPECAGLPRITIGEALEENPPVYFDRNLRNLVYVANGNDVQLVFSNWAYYPPFVDDMWEVAFDEMNAVTEQVASDLDVPYIDLMAELPQNEDYWHTDGEHQKPDGTYAQAEIYAAYLIEHNLIPAPDNP